MWPSRVSEDTAALYVKALRQMIQDKMPPGKRCVQLIIRIPARKDEMDRIAIFPASSLPATRRSGGIAKGGHRTL